MRRTAVVLSIALVGAVVGGLPRTARADTTFVVNRTGDAVDLNLADDICDVSSNTGKQCTLRAAIQEANATLGTDTIGFNITSTSKVISPSSPLPVITERVIIDGYTQPNAVPNSLAVGTNAVLKIVLDGINAGEDAIGLELATTNSHVRGLVIQRFDGAGILIPNSGLSGGPNVITGCYIGTNAAGTVARPNGKGVWIRSPLEVVGGNDPASRNVISGNGQGIRIESNVSNAVITNNYIGTTASGNEGLGNGAEGILIDGAQHSQIGGTPSYRNVISANGTVGVAILGDGSTEQNNVMEGNYVGTRADGTGSLGNAYGVYIAAGVENFVGVAGSGNVIANSTQKGIWLLQGSDGNSIEGNTIRNSGTDGIEAESGPNAINGNTIRDNGRNGVRLSHDAVGVKILDNNIRTNGALGIDLLGGTENSFGVTANDKADPDSGVNHRQNFPVLTSARRSAGTGVTEVVVTLNSNASTQLTIELFRAAPDASGFGEGQTRIATHTTTTDVKGDKTFSFLVSGIAVGTRLTATATATTAGETSEFSANRTVVAVP